MHAILGMLAVFTSGAFIKFVGRLLLIGFGFGLLSTAGMEFFLVQIEDYVRAQFTGLPATMVNFIGLMNLDLYINWVFLGVSVKMSVIGLYRLVPNGLGSQV